MNGCRTLCTGGAAYNLLKFNESVFYYQNSIEFFSKRVVDTYIVLFPDIIATLLVLDQFIVFWLAATEQICQGPNNQSLALKRKT